MTRASGNYGHWLFCKISSHSHVGGENAVEQLQLGQVKGPLQLVVVEGYFARAGAVQPGLHEGGPRVFKEEAAADVVLANAPGAGEHRPAAVVLHRVFPEEEVGEVADVVGGDEVWFCRRRSGKETRKMSGRKKEKKQTF